MAWLNVILHLVEQSHPDSSVVDMAEAEARSTLALSHQVWLVKRCFRRVRRV